jgi:hypothetical protein
MVFYKENSDFKEIPERQQIGGAKQSAALFGTKTSRSRKVP